jgi:predicted RNase H-like nuclease (RuvC/YqgF family)
MDDDVLDPETTGPTRDLPGDKQPTAKQTNPMLDRILEELLALREETRSLREETRELREEMRELRQTVASLDKRVRDLKTEMLREFQGVRSSYRQDLVDESKNLQAQIIELADRVKALEQRDQPQ